MLLLKRAGSHGAGTWAPPGGHLNQGEDFEEGAIPEVREETGVTVTEPRFLAVTNDVFADEGKHYVTIWLEAQLASGDAHIDAPEKMPDLGWFDWNDLPQPRFLALEHYLAGRSYPLHPHDQVGA